MAVLTWLDLESLISYNEVYHVRWGQFQQKLTKWKLDITERYSTIFIITVIITAYFRNWTELNGFVAPMTRKAMLVGV
jgi:hypothetical protein